MQKTDIETLSRVWKQRKELYLIVIQKYGGGLHSLRAKWVWTIKFIKKKKMKKNLDCFGLEIRIMEGKEVVVIDE